MLSRCLDGGSDSKSDARFVEDDEVSIIWIVPILPRLVNWSLYRLSSDTACCMAPQGTISYSSQNMAPARNPKVIVWCLDCCLIQLSSEEVGGLGQPVAHTCLNQHPQVRGGSCMSITTFAAHYFCYCCTRSLTCCAIVTRINTANSDTHRHLARSGLVITHDPQAYVSFFSKPSSSSFFLLPRCLHHHYEFLSE